MYERLLQKENMPSFYKDFLHLPNKKGTRGYQKIFSIALSFYTEEKSNHSRSKSLILQNLQNG